MEDLVQNLAEDNNIEKKCIIPEGVHIQGNLIANTDVDIAGEIEGDIEVHGLLTLDGRIHGASIKAEEIHIMEGVVRASVQCEKKFYLAPEAVVLGDIKSKIANIQGAVKGHVMAEEEILVEKTAVISGTVDSPKVNIELGAVCDVNLHDSNSDELSFKIF